MWPQLSRNIIIRLEARGLKKYLSSVSEPSGIFGGILENRSKTLQSSEPSFQQTPRKLEFEAFRRYTHSEIHRFHPEPVEHTDSYYGNISSDSIRMASKVPNVKLNNGLEIPIFGLGTWKSKPGEVTQAVKDAIDLGYRHIDCAYVYGNEKEIGAALKAKFAEDKVKREDLFITSKLWNTFHRPDLVEPAIKETLGNLGVDYLDLYLIHWPLAYKEEGELFPFDAQGKIQFSDVDYVDTWKEMEKLVKKGLTKSIGLSNFNKKQIERVLAVATIKPVVNQVECHPYLNQNKLRAYCQSKNIVLVGYSPLGSPDRPWAKAGDPQLLEDPKIVEIAKKYGKSPAQILLRYQIQRGVVTIPKSVTKSRIQQNFDVFDFELSKEDVKNLDSFDCNGRFCPMTAGLGHPHHPFENDEY